jgi:hypothetical protein
MGVSISRGESVAKSKPIKLVLVMLAILGVSLFLRPQAGQIVQVGPKAALAASCDDSGSGEQDANYLNACSMSLPATRLNQVIHDTSSEYCYYNGWTTHTDCDSPQWQTDADWWITSSIGPSTVVTVNLYPVSGGGSFPVTVIDSLTNVTQTLTSNSFTTPATAGSYSYYIEVTHDTAAPDPGGCSLGGSLNCTSNAGVDFTYNLSVTATPPATATPTPTPTPLPISPDGYEGNGGNDIDLKASMLSGLPGCITVNATISGPGDIDNYIFTAVKGKLKVSALSSFGMALLMQVTQTANGAPFDVPGNGSPNPSVNGTISQPGFTLITIQASDSSAIGLYTLTICNTPPAGPGPTATPAPTETASPTPNQGNGPDVAEPNNDFPSSFRLSPGNSVSLNFNSGILGQQDVDYFAMKVKTGVQYTCQTSNLGLGADTAMSVYGPQADASNVLGANDDINAQTGQVASKVTWTSPYDGDAYIVVSQNGALTVPGNATYSLTCNVGLGVSTGGVVTGGGGGGGGSLNSSASLIQMIATPTGQPTPVVVPVVSLTINIVVAYDENDNGVIDLTEGVSNMSVRVTDPNTNKELTHGMTDAHGSLALVIAAPQDQDVLAVIPFLSVGKKFAMSSGAAEWHILLPASSLPGVIP